MDRKSYKLTIEKSGCTPFNCPSCGNGVLKVQQGSFSYHETKLSRCSRRHEAFGFEWVSYVFSCILECTNPRCQEFVSCLGNGGVDQEYSTDENGEFDVSYSDFFKPKFFHPNLKIFTPPKKTPESVYEELNVSFSLVFSDPSSAANHVRIALENLLTELRIKRSYKTSGKMKYLNLHQRIDLLPSKFDHIKLLFYAVKWLGNAGSHSHKELSFDDVFDAYEIISQILEEIYNNKGKQIATMAKVINKRKGPRCR